MRKLASPFEMGNYLEDRGYDVFPFKTNEGTYRVSVFQHSQFVRHGKFEYPTWQEAQRETTKLIYNKLTENEN